MLLPERFEVSVDPGLLVAGTPRVPFELVDPTPCLGHRFSHLSLLVRLVGDRGNRGPPAASAPRLKPFMDLSVRYSTARWLQPTVIRCRVWRSLAAAAGPCTAAAWQRHCASFLAETGRRSQLTAARDTRDRTQILVCYDGSAESERALGRAGEIASAARCEVTVVSVAESLYQAQPYTGYADPAEEELHRRLLGDATCTLARHGIAAATLEPIGRTADAILAAAREQRADLIVVGSRHRRLIERLLFGSVSGQLVVESPCDVLVVR